MREFPWCKFVVLSNGERAWYCELCKLAKRYVSGGMIPSPSLRHDKLVKHQSHYSHQAIVNPPKEAKAFEYFVAEAKYQEERAMMQCFRIVYTLAKNDISLDNYQELRSLATEQEVPAIEVVKDRYMRYIPPFSQFLILRILAVPGLSMTA